MRTPFVLLKAIGRAVLHVSGVGGLYEIAVEAWAEVSDNAWTYWTKETDETQRRAELEEIIQASHADLLRAAAKVADEVAAERSQSDREALAQYLAQVPALVRQTMRRPEDPTGRSLRPRLALEKPEDLASFIPTRAPRFSPGDRWFDWTLVEMLGVGGFGEVWKAEHAHHPDRVRPVALKFCLDPTARERLLKHEAGLCLRVQDETRWYPGIVALEHTYLSADPPCLQYEYVDGGDLSGLIRSWHESDGPTPKQVIEAVLQVARTAAFAHQLKPPIVHRDFKPANILVSRENGKPRLKVADYGIGGVAIAQVVRATRNGTALRDYPATAVRGAYSANYASPEQMRGAGPDPRDDVHAIGVIWYQLVTGDLSRGRPGGSAWKKRLVEQGKLTPEMVALMESCFEDAEERPADAGILVEGLERLLMAGRLEGSAHSSRTWRNSLGMTMMRIEPGEFLMGSTKEQIRMLAWRCPGSNPASYYREIPQHIVRITKTISLASHPVTVEQFGWFVEATGYKTRAEMGEGSFNSTARQDHKLNWRNPGFRQTVDHPVVCVNHYDAVAFLAWLNKQDAREGRIYRLPSEAEWEYAARAGTRGLWGDSDDPAWLVSRANIKGIEDGYRYTSPVGSFAPNAWGLHDMIGNVWEWCDDWFDDEYYRKSPGNDPINRDAASGSSFRVFRGGSWTNIPAISRPGSRNGFLPDTALLSVAERTKPEGP